MRILLADDQTTLAAVIQPWLELIPGFRLVGVAADVTALTEQVQNLRPDILLFDWELPGFIDNATRQRLLEQLHILQPGLHIVALTAEPISRQQMLNQSVDAFVSKSESPDNLAQVLRQLHHVIPEHK